MAMRASADDIRRAAEDNAHAFKTPIAIMRQSLEPIDRLVPEDNTRGRRALEVIEQSVDRLDYLVACARHLDEAAAELIDRPRHSVDLSRLVGRMLDAYADTFVAQRIRLDARLQNAVVVKADEELLEVVLENVIDNALSVSPEYSAVTVELRTNGRRAALVVHDQGPGVPAPFLHRIFERYVSLRAAADGPLAAGHDVPTESNPHLGIGLWIVKRNLEAVDGTVWAENRSDKGLSVNMELPLAA
jgi:two-component system sensor histidine kinase ChvG